MEFIKKITATFSLLFLASFLFAQDDLRLEVAGEGVITQSLIDEGFESGLGSFITGGDALWTTQNTTVYNGSFSAQSGNISANGISDISVSVTVPDNKMGVLVYYAKFTGDNYFSSAFGLKVDGDSEWSVNYTFDWEEKKIFLEPGTHQLIWSVEQVYVYPGVNVIAWLDDISVSYLDQQAVRIVDGSEGNAKVLTSDSEGNASWQSANSIFENDVNVPLFLSGFTGQGILNLTQNGFGPGLDIKFNGNSFSDGVRVTSSYRSFFSGPLSTFGFYSDNPAYTGVYLNNPNSYGAYVYNSDGDGFYSTGSYDDGFVSTGAGGTGLYSGSADYHGIISSNADNDGVSISDAGLDGLSSLNSGNDGVFVSAAGNAGLRSENAINSSFVSTTPGLDGFSSDGAADYGYLNYGSGSYGFRSTSSGSYGIYVSGAAVLAGRFDGNVNVNGSLSKSAGTFKIDHPDDPENKYLYHSFVESPDMKNIYDGIAFLDKNGEAIVLLPDYFKGLNMEFRYQLTCIGGFANVYIKEEIKENEFKIAGGSEGLKVSWQVTGIRKDPYAEQNRVKVEVDKEEEFKGLYLHPELYNLPEEKGIDFNIEKRDNEQRAAKEAKLKLDENYANNKLKKLRNKAAEENEKYLKDREYINKMEEKRKQREKK